MTEEIVKKVAETPAEVLQKGVEATEQITKNVNLGKPIKDAKDYWKLLGPGLTTGASDDDPSGIATYSQQGAQTGFHLIWLALFTFPFMAVVQEMCARIGLETGQGLAANIRRYYPKWVLYVCTALLFFANALNIGADIGAMAKATQLLRPHMNFPILVVGFTAICLILQIFSTYEKYAKYLKWLAMILLSYVVTAFLVKLDWQQLLVHTVIPSITFSRDQIVIITAILGTTISPYLFFWQTSQEVEEDILAGETSVASRRGSTDEDIKNMRIDVWSGMLLSNIVMFFIIAVCAATLFNNGITNIKTAADAASALRPLAGEQAYLLFAIGIIGTGLLAVPVLAGSASYAISESFGWKVGLYHKLKQAYAFYGVIIIATLIGLAINFIGIDPIKALIYSAVINGLVAPVVLVLIVLLSSSKRVMGSRTNHPVITALGWIITAIMSVAGIATIVTLLPG